MRSEGKNHGMGATDDAMLLEAIKTWFCTLITSLSNIQSL
jgi:hypothetical protein